MRDSDKYTAIIRTLKKSLREISSELDKYVKALESGRVSNYAEVRQGISALYEQLRIVTAKWIDSQIPKEYSASLSSTIAALKNSVVKVNTSIIENAGKNKANVRNTLSSILNEAYSSFNTGLNAGEQTLLRFVNASQQFAKEEAALNKAVEQGFNEKGSSYQVKKRLKQELYNSVNDGQYVEIVDKNGTLRRYDLDSYTEMLARTKLADASAQAVLDTAKNVDADLVQISSHNTQTPLCAEYEGKVFSLSGKDPDFPVLDQVPPFHPNCMHSMTIVFKEALQIEGTFDKYVSFSNNDTGEHPTRTGFIPVADRGIA